VYISPIAKIEGTDVSNFCVSSDIKSLYNVRFQFAIGPYSIFNPKKGSKKSTSRSLVKFSLL
jgi:hypothetical protein